MIDGAEKTETTSWLGRPIWMIEEFALSIWGYERSELVPMHIYRIAIVRKYTYQERKEKRMKKKEKTPFKC